MRTRTVSGWDLMGPVCGVLATVGYLGAFWLHPMRGLGVRPEQPAETIAAAMAARLSDTSQLERFAGPMVLMAAVFFLLGFVGFLHQRLQERSEESRRWIATVFLAGGLVLAAALLFQGFIVLTQTTVVDLAGDAQVAKTLYLLDWLGLAVVVPGVAAMTGAAALLALRDGALHPSLGGLAILAFAATFVMYWAPVWLLWVLITSLFLLVRPEPTAVAASERSGLA
jgi:hypothetical protein